jgi:hypothetical protein
MANNPWLEPSRKLDLKRLRSDHKWLVCCHEASHAVAALYAGVRFVSVSLCPDGEDVKVLDRMEKAGGKVLYRDRIVNGYEIRKRVLTAVASVAFTRMVYPKESLVKVKMLGGCWTDWQQAEHSARQSFDCKNLRTYLRNVMDFAREMLLKHWDMVAKVATALIEKTTLTEDEVVALCCKADDPRMTEGNWGAFWDRSLKAAAA